MERTISVRLDRVRSREFSLAARRAASILGAVSLGLTTLYTSAARAQAQPSAAELATRRRLIEEAQRLRGQNQHERALDAAQRAMTIQPSPSLRMLVAQEEFAVGRYAEAFGNADLCMRDAAQDRQPNAVTVANTCRQLVEQARPRVGNIVVNVAPDAASHAPGLRLVIANHDVPATLLGAPYVVTPGRVRVQLSATDWREASQEIEIAAGRTETVTLTLEEIPRPVITPPDPPDRNVVAPPDRPIIIVPPQTPEPQGPGAGPYVLMGIGGAGLLASAGLYIGSLISRGECPVVMRPEYPAEGAPECRYQRSTGETPVLVGDQPQYPVLDRVVALETGAVIAAGAGAAILVGGIIWRVAGGSRPRPAPAQTMPVTASPQARIEPNFDPARAGVTVRW